MYVIWNFQTVGCPSWRKLAFMTRGYGITALLFWLHAGGIPISKFNVHSVKSFTIYEEQIASSRLEISFLNSIINDGSRGTMAFLLTAAFIVAYWTLPGGSMSKPFAVNVVLSLTCNLLFLKWKFFRSYAQNGDRYSNFDDT